MDLASNRRAYHDYEILETFEAGIALTGTEVKSLRNHGGNLAEGYVRMIKGEVWLVGASIAPYSHGSLFNHEERRDRKLLLHKREIAKIAKAVGVKGLAIVPLSLYLKQGKVKVKIGIGRGKKQHDKRATLLEKEKKREINRALKDHLR